jgi:AbrB family looped-hinge helix DNA binding protein
MRVTTKGQVTIPKEVRDKLGIVPGDEVGFREDGEVFILEKASGPANETPGERMVRMLAEFGQRMRREGKIVDPDMTTDEYMELIRGYSEDANDPGFQRRP